MKTFRRAALTGAALLCFPVAALSATVVPDSYTYITTPNVDRAYGYADDTGNQLTDGIRSTAHWQLEEPAGPNVGWYGRNPTIRFDFDQTFDFASLVMTIQDTGGAFGVGIASGIDINGLSYTISSLSAGGPVNLGFDLSTLAETDSLLVTVDRNTVWTFISEFTFDVETATVPLPASLPLLLAGLGGLVVARRRKG